MTLERFLRIYSIILLVIIWSKFIISTTMRIIILCQMKYYCFVMTITRGSMTGTRDRKILKFTSLSLSLR